MSMMPRAVVATCHCGQHRIPLSLDASALPAQVDCCHCTACRQVTGAPMACYMVVPHALWPSVIAGTSLPDGVRAYKTSQKAVRYFCTTCGCHLAVESTLSSGEGQAQKRQSKWHIPVGCLAFEPAPMTLEEERALVDSTYQLAWHQYLGETVDGGMSRLIVTDGLPRWSVDKDTSPVFDLPAQPGPVNNQFRTTKSGEELLEARCRCGGVRVTIRRPCAIPLRPCVEDNRSADGRRWIAGNCVCRDCRLASGFPVIGWTYVGREHLMFEGDALQFYQSSKQARRGFCSVCGATVSWDGGQTTVDIATALFEREDGEGVVGVEREWSYLEEDVSYPTDGRDRLLLQALETGMKTEGGKGK